MAKMYIEMVHAYLTQLCIKIIRIDPASSPSNRVVARSASIVEDSSWLVVIRYI